MGILTNKHFVVAMLVTPVLAVLAYFLTDYLVSEHPHVAEQGASYKLAAKPNCRYASGKCELKNGTFLVTLTPERLENQKIRLNLDSNFSLEGVKIALSLLAGASQAPSDMQALDETSKRWQVLIDRPASEDHHLRLVISARGSLYFAEVTTIFFSQDRPYQAN